MNLNFSEYSANQRYHLMTQTIIPRPIAWALTLSGDDANNPEHLNLAPFSYFSAVSSAPPLLMLSVGKKPNGDDKDTLVNVKRNGKMVIHIASDNQAEVMTKTAASLEHGDSELTHPPNEVITTTPFDGFSLPRLAQCDIAYGCELFEIKEIGDVPQSLIFVEVKQLFISPEVSSINNDRIKVYAENVSPLARLGANEYSGITKPFKKSRPE